VNLSALALPALVGWCVDPAASPASEALQPVGGLPAPTDALAAILALQWLEHHPEVLLAYQQLEAHPLAAALDQRPPDQACIQRYRQAARRQALLQLRQQHQDLQADLQELAAELAPRRLEQLQALDMQEQLQALRARLQRAEQAEARGKELEHSLLAQQADLEQLARRLALLEHLVAEGSDASLRLQHRLAQALA
jgi:type IV secretory pathway VirD2 relaxase